jgi:phosphoribosylformylglycinamidine (FGAM) synthase-like enzyme
MLKSFSLKKNNHQVITLNEKSADLGGSEYVRIFLSSLSRDSFAFLTKLQNKTEKHRKTCNSADFIYEAW